MNHAVYYRPGTQRLNKERQEIPTLRFDLNRNSSSNSVFFCRRNTMGDYLGIGGTKLMNLIQKSKVKQIVLYIHGYSTHQNLIDFQGRKNSNPSLMKKKNPGHSATAYLDVRQRCRHRARLLG